MPLTDEYIKALRDLTTGQPEYCHRSFSEPMIAELCARVLDAEARVKVLEDALRELADASDTVGITYFDTDDMPPNVVRMQQATISARKALEAEK